MDKKQKTLLTIILILCGIGFAVGFTIGSIANTNFNEEEKEPTAQQLINDRLNNEDHEEEGE